MKKALLFVVCTCCVVYISSFAKAESAINSLNSVSRSFGVSEDIETPKVIQGEASETKAITRLKNREKINPPLIVAIHGVDSGEIGLGLEYKHVINFVGYIEDHLRKYGSRGGSQRRPGVDTQAILQMIKEHDAAVRAALSSKSSGNTRNTFTTLDYLTELLENSIKLTGSKAEIVNLEWDRDPDNSAQFIKKFKLDLLAIQLRAVKEKRPLHIVAFSWGSVIMYQSLLELMKAGQPVYVDYFVSMGSPLVPAGLITKIFDKIESHLNDFQDYCGKPACVKRWVNMYADYDNFSGWIKAADNNIRVDMYAEKQVRELKEERTLMNFLVINRDIKSLTESVVWHLSYFDNVRVPLESRHGAEFYQELVKRYAPTYTWTEN
ncbi:MAG: hypothetical protein WCS77_05185 [Elusimicrobiaceae bacterium]